MGEARFKSDLYDTIYKESLYIYGIIQFGPKMGLAPVKINNEEF